MLYFAQCGNPTENENFIVDAKSASQVLQWLEELNGLSDEPIEEFGDSAAIIGSTYYNVEIYDERNEEHIDARENGVLYIE
jgi:hypothetical protein